MLVGILTGSGSWIRSRGTLRARARGTSPIRQTYSSAIVLMMVTNVAIEECGVGNLLFSSLLKCSSGLLVLATSSLSRPNTFHTSIVYCSSHVRSLQYLPFRPFKPWDSPYLCQKYNCHVNLEMCSTE
ncbi:hypothetical protein L916_06727 [Phytophthora nicotianae]|uniref:Uncharacterized protein n=1 Tax=Phytophthora nicotianae TaxID=4792 RepID=W2JA46_PHYNI|nr:hypothetical protein L916_06727 [Phytophthora nicotianae]